MYGIVASTPVTRDRELEGARSVSAVHDVGGRDVAMLGRDRPKPRHDR